MERQCLQALFCLALPVEACTAVHSLMPGAIRDTNNSCEHLPADGPSRSPLVTAWCIGFQLYACRYNFCLHTCVTAPLHRLDDGFADDKQIVLEPLNTKGSRSRPTFLCRLVSIEEADAMAAAAAAYQQQHPQHQLYQHPPQIAQPATMCVGAPGPLSGSLHHQGTSLLVEASASGTTTSASSKRQQVPPRGSRAPSPAPSSLAVNIPQVPGGSSVRHSASSPNIPFATTWVQSPQSSEFSHSTRDHPADLASSPPGAPHSPPAHAHLAQGLSSLSGWLGSRRNRRRSG